MSESIDSEFDSDADETPTRPGQLSSNAHWIFGSIYAALALVGFSFGVWAGAARTKPAEVAEAKQTENTARPIQSPKPQEPKAKEPEPKANEGEPKPKEPEPKAKEPDPMPKAKEPEPKPKPKEPEPKKVEFAAVSFKQVQPILRAYCFDCHGGSTGKPKGGVDLTSVAKMLKSKDDPLVRGKPEESTVYTSIKNGEMPPDGKKGPNEQELKLIHDWIAGGAKERRRPVRTRGCRAAARRRVALTPPPGAG